MNVFKENKNINKRNMDWKFEISISKKFILFKTTNKSKKLIFLF